VAKNLVGYFKRIETECKRLEECPNDMDFRKVVGSSSIAESIKKGEMDHMLKHFYRAIRYYSRFDRTLPRYVSMIVAWIYLLQDLYDNRKLLEKHTEYLE
jgi:hypothetical protein